MMFWDRLTQREVNAPSTPTWPGRLIVTAEGADQGARVNNIETKKGDALVPGPSGFWSRWENEATGPTRGRFHKGWDVEEQDAMAIRQLGHRLQNGDGGWLEWCDVSPLAPNLDEATHVHPLEEHIEREFPHLAEVCRNPTTHIRTESDRIPIARARRLDKRAISFLAAHSEDWGHRTLSGVHPHRVLAQVREEDWNLYENQVAARLIDHLVGWLQRRIGQLQRVVQDVYLRLDGSSAQSAGSRHKRERMYKLWGETWDAAQGRERAEQAIERLRTLLYRLLGLMDSELYRRVPRRSYVPRVLRQTNLLSNEDHYRGVARLWFEWSTLSNPDAETAQERWERHQTTHHSFAAWSLLLVVRACAQLHMEPETDKGWERPIHRGTALRLAREVELRWCDDNTFELLREDRTLVRIVPLCHAFGDFPSAEEQATVLKEAVGKADAWTIVLHPGATGQQISAFVGVGHPPMPPEAPQLDFVQVSPFELESVERVARAIRWATLAPRMLSYPPSINLPPSLPSELRRELKNKPWATLTEDALIVREPAPLRDLQQLDLEQRCNEATASKNDLERQRNEFALLRDQARGDRRETSRLNKEHRQLLEPLREAEELEKQILAFDNEFKQGRELLDELTRCPVCDGTSTFTGRDNHTFAAHCQDHSCKAHWHLHPQPDGTILPMLTPGDADLDDLEPHAPPQKAGELWGGDVLAIPKQTSP